MHAPARRHGARADARRGNETRDQVTILGLKLDVRLTAVVLASTILLLFDEEGRNPLGETPAFQEFQREILDR
jgi:hypothetical protein